MASNSEFKLPDELAPVGGRQMPATLSSRIVATVRDGLFAGTLSAGDMLGTEADLSERFGVSRVAARDALKRLEAMGIVDIRAGAGGGARIAQGNTQLFADALAIQLKLTNASPSSIMDVQRAIEMMTAELAAVNASEKDLADLDMLVEEAERHLENAETFTRLSFAFHLGVADAACNDVLKMQLIAIRFVAWPSHNPALTTDIAKHIVSLHREVVVLLRARDAEGARSLMSGHMKEIKSRRVVESEGKGSSAADC